MKCGRLKSCILLALFAGTPAGVYAQERASGTLAFVGNSARFVIEQSTSLAWWQMNPNYGHLWASTCPADPSWSAGEGHSNGFDIQPGTAKKTRVSAHMDYRIPLYPRTTVSSVCRKAVRGQITLRTPGDLRTASGKVEVSADSLETGSAMRNIFQKRSVLHTGTHPNITFTLDSIGNFEPGGDTITAIAKGSWMLHGVTKPLFVPIVISREANGVRVRGKTVTFPRVLLEEYRMSKVALGAGVGMNLWKELHFGFDLIFKPEGGGAGNTP